MATPAATTPTRRLTFEWDDPVAAAARGRPLGGLGHLRAIAAGEIPPGPLDALLGFQPLEAGPGRVAFAGVPGEIHFNQTGVVHGGFFCAFLDLATGSAVQSLVPADRAWTTVALAVSLVRRIDLSTGRLTCAAEALHRGARMITAEARIRDEAGRLYAHGTSTCLVLEPREGGR